ncbi:DinB family protein [Pontibacillus yanchengensis]|uniref:DinB-like domain-containing protein n=1 Tax=Pontibacillus yanchengensis Y32 TaxID=1385514 RepID=A0A0A2T6Z3_9BACI|nr:DinB family protein [Pontibacillus yanchengensis]KGP71582.1 hypothetical protein N782_18010 [Pontibacillus yanchengensis Y32]
MREEQLFEHMKLWRNWTVSFLLEIPEGIIDRIPNGHNNNIRWNTGHILVGWDQAIFPELNEERQLPLTFHKMFPNGSNPEIWTEQPPSMDDLIKIMEIQPNLLEKACKGHLDKPLKESFLGMTTLGDVIVFHMNHENLHMGLIKSMKQILVNDMIS